MLAKNQLHTAEITGLTSEGSGVCRVEEMAVFVPSTAVGDLIELRIVKVMSSYAFGIVEKILTPSPDRIQPDCPVYKKCGGCVYRHISYEAECCAKDTVVRDAFTRIGGLSPEFGEFISAGNTDHYRNKAQFPLAVQDGKLSAVFTRQEVTVSFLWRTVPFSLRSFQGSCGAALSSSTKRNCRFTTNPPAAGSSDISTSAEVLTPERSWSASW